MLTGDKVETATCIAISTGIKSKKQGFFFIKDIANNDDMLLRELENFNSNFDKVLIIDGECLLACLDKHEKLFFEASMKVLFIFINFRLIQLFVVVVLLLLKQE